MLIHKLKMKRCWELFTSLLIIIINVDLIENSCIVKNDCEIVCTSVSNLSNETWSGIPNLESIISVTVANSSELFLDPTALKSIRHLRKVNITHSNIDSIFRGTFQFHEDLQQVNLDYNGIRNIHYRSFAQLPALENISLAGNNLNSVAKDSFARLLNRELVLSKNNISLIQDGAFVMPILKVLKLDHNQLHEIYIHKVLPIPKLLKVLWLQNNFIESIKYYMLKGLWKLEVLNLSSNLIYTMERDSFDDMPDLNTLALSNNRLKDIQTIYVAPKLSRLEKLYVDNNRLMFLYDIFFDGGFHLKEITLVGNPWFCPCFNQLQKILVYQNISQRCTEVYSTGEKPICINQGIGDSVCKYRSNEELRNKYETSRGAPIPCIV